MKFEMGQSVWWATWDASDSYLICPDCGGTGRLRVTFHDETQVSIDCRNCCSGYDPPSGRVHVYTRKAVAKLTTITGFDVEGIKVRYRTPDSYIIEEANLFDSEADALLRAAEMAAKEDQAQRDKVLNKEKDTRTWAWNASYHRREIERAKKQIEYHSAKLAVAAIRAKDKSAA